MHLDLTDGKKTAFVVLLKRAVAVAVVLLTAAPVNAEGPTDKTALEMAIATATRTPPHRCFVPIIKANDEASYWVGVIINRTDTFLFLIDTGFTGSLLIPRGFLNLLRTDGALTKLDRNAPPIRSTLADGSEITQETVIVREIILPFCRAFSNVRAIVSRAGSSPLIGQGILSNFSSAGIDQREGGLILVPEGVSP